MEASEGAAVAKRIKAEAVAAMAGIWEFHLCNTVATLSDLPIMFMDCGVSPESQSLLLPLLARCSTPNELLLLAHEAVQQDTVEGAGVVVCTLHSAKGREWSTVIMPAFEETILPGRNEDSVSEDRRLAFVGMTRAKENLIVTFCNERQKLYGFGSEQMSPSRFISEAGLQIQK